MISNRWIASARYDLPFIALAPLAGLLICAIAFVVGEQRLLSIGFVEITFFVLGMPHYLSSYVFYLDDANVRHYRTRKLAFFAGPLLVVAALTASLALRFYFLVAVFVSAWNVYHVSRQSAGILTVYRHRGNGNNAAEKWPALVAIVGSAIGFALMAAAGASSLVKIIGTKVDWLTYFAGPAVVAVSAAGAAILAKRMWKRSAPLSEWVFLISSLLLFVPYLLLDDFTLATSGLLAGHYIQYVSVLWLVNRRKYTTTEGSFRQRFLSVVSKNGLLLACTLVSLALIPFALDRIIHRYNWIAFHTLFLNAVVLVHFYLDGVFWAFKDPHVRSSLGPYLVGWRGEAPAITRSDTLAA